MKFKELITVFFLCLTIFSSASIAEQNEKEKKTFKARQEIRVAATYTLLLNPDLLRGSYLSPSAYDRPAFNGRLARHSVGASLFWGYIVSNYAVLGINMAFRAAPGKNFNRQVITGAMSKWYLTAAKKILLRPFITFGFQALTTVLEIEDDTSFSNGSGTSRTMHLGIGAVISQNMFIEITYGYSRMTFFQNTEKSNFDHINFEFGYRFDYLKISDLWK